MGHQAKIPFQSIFPSLVLELPEFGLAVNFPSQVILSTVDFRDSATSGSAACLFGFLLFPPNLKPCFAKYF